jgi:hypothetical protein
VKKVLATILSFVYLTSSMGATVHLHYCMGRLASWSLIDHESKNCTQCGMVKKSTDTKCMGVKMDCCRDEHKQIKSTQDQKSFPAEFFNYNHPAPIIALQETATFGMPVFSDVIAHPHNTGPPLLGNVSRFILFCNFRI